MKPAQHHSNTRVLNAPEGWNQSQLPVGALPITDADAGNGTPAILSYWRPDAEELALLNAGGLVCLSVLGGNMPPVLIIAWHEPPAQQPAAIAQPVQPAAQDAKDAPETMEIRYETYGNCLWHTDCKINSFKSGVMKILSHEDASSTMKCLHCGQVGAYPKGSVGTVCVPVISTDAAILARFGRK